MNADLAALFPRFSQRRVATSAGTFTHLVTGGAGPPLLLLHGCPQTLAMWARVAADLARDFTVVAADLRGYGDSSKPAGTPDHAAHSFRAMAGDVLDAMASLGHPRFAVAGHDRGARVAHRLVRDRPGQVAAAALLDILPTATMYARADAAFALAYWEWFFLPQPPPMPERLIGADPDAFLHHELGALAGAGAITPAAWREYRRCIADPAAVHGMCEDYRAGASIDLEHDRADGDARIAAPVLVLWGAENRVWRGADVLAIWRQHAADVRGEALPCGHYLAEEQPALTAAHLRAFLAGRR